MRRVALALASLAAIALPAVAAAGVQVRGVDASGYPTIRLSVVSSGGSRFAPALAENGNPVSGLTAVNLGRTKSVVLAIDRSRSMAGASLRDATRAARAFVAAKPAGDRVAIVAFGRHALQLTQFTSASIDADTALRDVAVDSRAGTALYDAVALSTQALATEANPGRVVIVLTDGHDVSSAASLQEAVADAHRAGVAVYPIGIESSDFDPSALKALARDTGGTYFGAASSRALADVYASVAHQLGRTWRLEYPTSARPGDKLRLQAAVAGAGSATAAFSVPDIYGTGTIAPEQPSKLLPPTAYDQGSTLLFGLIVGGLVLLACWFLIAAKRGSWVKSRLKPHLAVRQRRAKEGVEKERLAMADSLFRATERAFGHLKQWRKVKLMLERADLPLRTVEFVYLAIGSGLALGLVGAMMGSSWVITLASMAAGVALPYGFVWFKVKSRLKKFENQLPDLLVTLAASLKAGHSFKQGIQTIVDEGQEPASKDFKRVLTETQLGRPMDAALNEMAERVGSKNLDFVITAVTIQRQVGGSLAGLFDMVADTVRQRQQFARRIKSLTAMGRMSAYVLCGLPFFMALAITVMNGTYMHPLYHTHVGHMLIYGMLTMMLFGSLILKKIVSFRG